jgi:hypothetical protein
MSIPRRLVDAASALNQRITHIHILASSGEPGSLVGVISTIDWRTGMSLLKSAAFCSRKLAVPGIFPVMERR